MARGGARQGRAGKQYGARSDLQLGARLPAQAAPGQTYGAAGRQIAAQQAVPLLRSVPAPAPGAAGLAGVPPGGVSPAPPAPLDAPTMRPGEPLTTGLPTGPGAGPEAITPPSPLLQAVTTLQGIGSSANSDVARMRDVLSAALANENLR